MTLALSPNTQAILLLTAPLIVGRNAPSANILTLTEYKRLAQFLREQRQQPADLLAPDAQPLLVESQRLIDSDRLKRLLDRGFLLSQAIERWQTRALWVVSRADATYPRRWKARLRDDAPPVLYGCGEVALLEQGGLAVVGSRQVDESLVAYTENIGRMVATACRALISGGARGIDQAAMHGALESGGKVIGVLADSLERAVLSREHRHFLMEGHLVLVSTYDPAAGFNVGHAMQRNKLIYALADAALVVHADYNKGGTWAGAVEQLEKLRFVPVYVRSQGTTSQGLEALQQKGALPWPHLETPEVVAEVLAVALEPGPYEPRQDTLFSEVREESPQGYAAPQMALPDEQVCLVPSPTSPLAPAEALFAKVRELLEPMHTPRTDIEVAADLGVLPGQAQAWLRRLVQESVLEEHPDPVRYSRRHI